MNRTIRVLVAEDDAALRGRVVGALRCAGFVVEPAVTGYQAVERLGGSIAGPQPDFDLVIADLEMPGYDGLDLLAVARHLPLGPPVILITALGDAAIHAAARRIGAAAVLDKPFDVDELVAVAEALTSGATGDTRASASRAVDRGVKAA